MLYLFLVLILVPVSFLHWLFGLTPICRTRYGFTISFSDISSSECIKFLEQFNMVLHIISIRLRSSMFSSWMLGHPNILQFLGCHLVRAVMWVSSPWICTVAVLDRSHFFGAFFLDANRNCF